MPEETKTESKAPPKKTAPKKAAKPKGRLFAFGRPNYVLGVPMPGGGVQHKNMNGHLPIVELVDPVDIEVVSYAAGHSPGRYAGQFHPNPEVKEVSKGMSDDEKSLVTGDGHEFNKKAFDLVFQKAKRV